ncbi:RING finger protein 122 isoform X1 [Aquila chrysaetos chrysaetos]|uniref:RING finger protein 122 isoform X1 n=1 Tax=Aquila chrysaetos chrysaetos TaxID=223781 RepID=UPI00117666B3|nr:RING finger protein 122 isoform X1 [Aquila chrysaetos chrysaetos]
MLDRLVSASFGTGLQVTASLVPPPFFPPAAGLTAPFSSPMWLLQKAVVTCGEFGHLTWSSPQSAACGVREYNFCSTGWGAAGQSAGTVGTTLCRGAMSGCDVQEFVRWVLSPLRRAQRDALGRLVWDWQGLSPSGFSFPAHPVLLLENLWDAHPSLSLLSAELILLPLSPDKGFSISSRVATQLPTEQVQVIPRRPAGSCGSSRASARCGQRQPCGPLSPRLSRGCNSGLGCFCRHGSRGMEGNGWCLSADFWNSSQFEIHVASVIVSLVTHYCYHNPLLSVWPASNEVSSVHQQLLCSLCLTTSEHVCATITSFSCSVFSFRADILFFFFFF